MLLSSEWLRCYPLQFARNLKTLFEGRREFPLHMRRKQHVDLRMTDKDICLNLPTGDVYMDAKMPEVWQYLYSSKHLEIPDSWEFAMKQFHNEVLEIATWLQCHPSTVFRGFHP